MSLTAQQVFDNALNGIRAQGYKPSKSGPTCMYRSPDNLKCGIGHSIPDELYDPRMDCFGDDKKSSYEINLLVDTFSSMEQLFNGLDVEFLQDMQGAHDLYLPNADCFEKRMKEIAAGYGLVYAPR